MLCVYLCVFRRCFHLWIFSEILMNPNPFLRKQFVSDKLVSTQEPVYQDEGNSHKNFCGSVLSCPNTIPWYHRTNPHTQLIRTPFAACVGTTHTHTSTHWNRVQKPQRGCNQASWQVYPSDTSIAEDKPRAFPRISQIHAFIHSVQ